MNGAHQCFVPAKIKQKVLQLLKTLQKILPHLYVFHSHIRDTPPTLGYDYARVWADSLNSGIVNRVRRVTSVVITPNYVFATTAQDGSQEDQVNAYTHNEIKNELGCD